MRAAADELRAELAGDTATFVVNRNINFTNICIVGCAFCGFGQGKRSPDAYEVAEDDFADRVRDAIAFGATEICMQGGIHPEYTLEDYGRWLRLAKEVAPAAAPPRLLADGDRLHVRALGHGTPATSSSTWSSAVSARRPARRRRCSTTACASGSHRTSCPVARWVEIIEASHAAGLRSTSTVMFGHIEEPRELARHMRVIRALQERTGGITEFVPLSFIPFNTLLGRTHGIEEISAAGEPQAHRRLPPGARQERSGTCRRAG